jgi:hypothetical protein
MKKLSLAIALTATLFAVSCKKDDPTPTAPAHVGLWKGKYGSPGSYPTTNWWMLFKSDGKVRVYDGADTTSASKADGTYSISGGTITTSYAYSVSNTYSTTATINAQSTFQEGTYGTGTATTGGGNFFLVKQ